MIDTIINKIINILAAIWKWLNIAAAIAIMVVILGPKAGLHPGFVMISEIILGMWATATLSKYVAGFEKAARAVLLYSFYTLVFSIAYLLVMEVALKELWNTVSRSQDWYTWLRLYGSFGIVVGVSSYFGYRNTGSRYINWILGICLILACIQLVFITFLKQGGEAIHLYGKKASDAIKIDNLQQKKDLGMYALITKDATPYEWNSSISSWEPTALTQVFNSNCPIPLKQDQTFQVDPNTESQTDDFTTVIKVVIPKDVNNGKITGSSPKVWISLDDCIVANKVDIRNGYTLEWNLNNTICTIKFFKNNVTVDVLSGQLQHNNSFQIAGMGGNYRGVYYTTNGFGKDWAEYRKKYYNSTGTSLRIFQDNEKKIVITFGDPVQRD